MIRAQVGIREMGGFVPPVRIDNATVARLTGRDAAFIARRTGITERRFAPDDLTTSDMGALAVRDLFAGCAVEPADLGWMACATSTPDKPQPATAALIQDAVGLPGVPCVDLNAVCLGTVTGIQWCAAMVAASQRPALLVAADRYSGILNRQDYRTSLFGDGAWACLLDVVPASYGVLAGHAATHGNLAHLVKVPPGGGLFEMEGRPVADYVRAYLPPMVEAALGDARLSVGDVDRWCFHQANPLLIAQVGDMLGIDLARVTITADRWGNQGAASAGLALWEANNARPIERGEIVVVAGVGGGMGTGVLVLRWY